MHTFQPDRRALRRLAQGDAPRGGPRLALGPGAALLRGRVHEICGPARRSLAAILAGVAERAGETGPILWIRAPGADGRPCADGLAPFFNPGRLVIAAPRRAEDAPWCAEEALRAGACGLVLAELTAPLRLTPVRRLHLAARAGAERAAEAGAPPPLALLLTPGDGGCEGVESRWFCRPERACEGKDTALQEERRANATSSDDLSRAAPQAVRPARRSAPRGAVEAAGQDARVSTKPRMDPSVDRPDGAPRRREADQTASETPTPAAAQAAPPERTRAASSAAAGPANAPSTPTPTAETAAPAAGKDPNWTSGGPETWRLELRRARLSPPRRWHAVWRADAPRPLRLVPSGAPEDAALIDAPPPETAAVPASSHDDRRQAPVRAGGA